MKVVTPPARAEALPEVKSSAVRCGPETSEKCRWASTTPGKTNAPPASTTRSLRGCRSGPTSTMRPWRQRTFACRSPSDDTTVPPRTRRLPSVSRVIPSARRARRGDRSGTHGRCGSLGQHPPHLFDQVIHRQYVGADPEIGPRLGKARHLRWLDERLDQHLWPSENRPRRPIQENPASREGDDALRVRGDNRHLMRDDDNSVAFGAP